MNAEQKKETKGFLCVCKECDWTDAFDAVSAEDAQMNGEDPAQEHYMETNHACASVPASKLPTEAVREMVFRDC